MITALWLFGPAAAIAAVVFGLVAWQADPGGAWPPTFVGLFTAVPIFFVVFVISMVIEIIRWVL